MTRTHAHTHTRTHAQKQIWSESAVEDALAWYEPNKAPPKWKVTRNGGKSEIMRDMAGGTGERIKRYYQGWLAFLKDCKNSSGELTRAVSVGDIQDVDLYFINSRGLVNRIERETPTALGDAVAFACVPKDKPCFKGGETQTPDFFINVGNREGASITV